MLGLFSRYSIHLFSFRGIPVSANPSVVIGAAALALWQNAANLNELEFGLMAALCCFSLLLHELAHLVAATALHIPLRKVVLHPLGSYTMFGRSLTFTEASTVALSGIAASLVLALMFSQLSNWHYAFTQVAIFNSFLAIVNLLPAQPLDCAVILKQVLAKLGVKKVHYQSAKTGMIVSTGLAGGFLLYAPEYALLLPLFLTLSAFNEYMFSMTEDIARLLTVRETMSPLSSLKTFPHGTPAIKAARTALTAAQEFFPITMNDIVVGFVDRDALIKQGGLVPDDFILSVAVRDLPQLPVEASLTQALEKFEASGVPALVITSEEKPIGILREKQIIDAVVLSESERIAKVTSDESGGF